MDINTLLDLAATHSASDLHLQVGRKPLLRINGTLREVEDQVLTDEGMQTLLSPVVDSSVWGSLEESHSSDFSYSSPSGRYRVNIFFQQGHLGAVFRSIPERIPTLSEIGAPVPLMQLAREPRGLLLVTGPTGSGKSTTLAAVLDLINSERSEHILTIEDPIEFVHHSKGCLINQREVGRDTPDFARALRDALREDPDVILVGEMRDFETISIALTAAETGHLVLGTLHTSSAPSSVDRIIDSFPEGQQQQARVMLGNSLVGVVSQALIPTRDGQGRAAAHEIMVVNNPVRAYIRKQDTKQLRGVLQTNFENGMQTLDRALVSLIGDGLISEDEARARAQSKEEFEQLLSKVRSGETIPLQDKVTPEMLPQTMSQSEQNT